MGFANFFDVRSLVPRARRRISPRETAKGVVPSAHLTQAEAQKRAQRRANRRALAKAAVDGLRENPTGTKLLRSFAKAAGYVVMDSDGKKDFVRAPTAPELRRWNAGRDEAKERQGHQGFKIPRRSDSAVRVMGAA